MTAALAALCPLLGPLHLVVALALVVLDLSLTSGRPARYELVVAVLNAIGLPFVAASVWTAWPVPVLLVVLGLPWLEAALRRAAASIVAGEVPPVVGPALLPASGNLPGGRFITPYLLALSAGLLVQVFVGIVGGQTVLLGTALVLLAFLGALVAAAYVRIPPGFLAVRAATVRLLANDTAETTIAVASRARLRIGVLIVEPYSWTGVSPTEFAIAGEEREVRVRLTPPLAGPLVVTATATAVDPWGLTAARQNVDLVHLRVIPRAAYAAWLARRYLDQTRGGDLAAVNVPEPAGRGNVRRGLDYYGARPYEPGDALKDVFWKHTLKLGQLVTKERRDALGEAVIVAANLAAKDAEAADWLAYNVLMAALTLAGEGVPLAFAAYTDRDVVAVTPPLAPYVAVRHAMGMVEGIRIAPMPVRVLKYSQIARLRRNISRLVGSGSEPAIRLARILTFEHRARMHRARDHPASAALGSAASRMSTPAAILAISSTAEDAEALEITMERLWRRGFHMIQLPAARPALTAGSTAGERGRPSLGRPRRAARSALTAGSTAG